ncbi:transcriptional regulator, MarR family [Acidothermus cellulolyticus 11B]|uniref:Transcriptional regulator, MarR family n=1 Tax=Acidothermus cellulolyticus (strain ATCC 43068 / DSM 8971 / 11B) TaxID=351607 RepID=A0LTW0_ACIC1|nr:MarR family transcriptional regulator [Acidothermus cellulolyticus]ABK52870.1 transcriptional regulator, MarR family [Acidothermus cellulolyticus 11B]
MTGYHTLAETEKAMATHLKGLPIDMAAAEAVSNLYRAANIARNHLTQTVLKDVDLTWTAFVVLWVTWMWDGIESRHAAEEAAISKATLTGVVQTLERRGLLARFGDSDDRRLVRLRLTNEGRSLMQKLYPVFNAEEQFIVSTLSPRVRSTMTRGLRAIVAHLESQSDTRRP